MEFCKLPVGRILFLRLDPGEEVVESLAKVANELGLGSAVIVSGVGQVKNSVIAYYDLESRRYITREVREPCELLSLSGNISRSGDDYVVHAHVTLATPEFGVIGGHLMKAVVSATAEIFLIELCTGLKRIADEATGLKILTTKH